MKIILAADGSKYTKKALAFLVTHEGMASSSDEVIVVHAQMALPPRVQSAVGSRMAREYQAEEADKVLNPIRKFLDKHDIPYQTEWSVGSAHEAVLKAARKHKAHLIVMGTHGHGLVGRAFLGSVAQKVVTQADVPVMLVK